MPGDQTTDPELMPISYTSLVHLVIRCDQPDCNFRTEDYLRGRAAAEQHHRDTGHSLSGEEAHAVWIGTEAQA